MILFFSEDLSFASIYLVTKEAAQIMSMQGYLGVTEGIKTERLQQYLQEEYTICDDNCFSLIFKERTFDFQTKNRTQRDKIVKEIRFLRECLEL